MQSELPWLKPAMRQSVMKAHELRLKAEATQMKTRAKASSSAGPPDVDPNSPTHCRFQFGSSLPGAGRVDGGLRHMTYWGDLRLLA